jgi:TRAP-type C4-dicarboxylate transport system permease small subunit
MRRHLICRLDRAVGAVVALGQWLVLPVSLLLFLQWPLRDVVHGWSREANDLAQWLFALYVSLALTDATRQRTHLAADALARHYPERRRRQIFRAAALLCLVPWSLFILIAGAAPVWQSVRQLEQFPDTYDPGYFVVKVSAWLLALLVLVQALVDAAQPVERRP